MAPYQLLRAVSFACSILNSLVAGCMSTIPIYAPRLILDLGYTQAQLNVVTTVAMLSTFLMSPVGGYLCRLLSPRILTLLCGGLLGGGYILTALAFFDSRRSNIETIETSFWTVVLAHFMIGSGTSSLQLSALDTCAKNLVEYRYKGLLISVPVTAVGLGGIAFSQIASHHFMITQDPHSAPYLDAGKFLVLLSSMAVAVGLVSAVGLVIVQKEAAVSQVLVSEAEGSNQSDQLIPKGKAAASYGVVDEENLSESTSSCASSSSQLAREDGGRLLLHDQALWWLMIGMALLPGPIAVYLNNLGTIIMAINDDLTTNNGPSAGSHIVQQITILSTVATITRFILGVLSDCVAPNANRPLSQSPFYRTRFIVLIIPALLVSIGYLLLAAPLARPQNSNITLHICSALLGLGYGCNSAIMPVIAQAWGSEFFSIICSWVALSPAPAIVVWGWLYSSLYKWALDTTTSSQCIGWHCYGIWALISSATAVCAALAWSKSFTQLRGRGVIV